MRQSGNAGELLSMPANALTTKTDPAVQSALGDHSPASWPDAYNGFEVTKAERSGYISPHSLAAYAGYHPLFSTAQVWFSSAVTRSIISSLS